MLDIIVGILLLVSTLSAIINKNYRLLSLIWPSSGGSILIIKDLIQKSNINWSIIFSTINGIILHYIIYCWLLGISSENIETSIVGIIMFGILNIISIPIIDILVLTFILILTASILSLVAKSIIGMYDVSKKGLMKMIKYLLIEQLGIFISLLGPIIFYFLLSLSLSDIFTNPDKITFSLKPIGWILLLSSAIPLIIAWTFKKNERIELNPDMRLWKTYAKAFTIYISIIFLLISSVLVSESIIGVKNPSMTDVILSCLYIVFGIASGLIYISMWINNWKRMLIFHIVLAIPIFSINNNSNSILDIYGLALQITPWLIISMVASIFGISIYKLLEKMKYEGTNSVIYSNKSYMITIGLILITAISSYILAKDLLTANQAKMGITNATSKYISTGLNATAIILLIGFILMFIGNIKDQITNSEEYG